MHEHEPRWIQRANSFKRALAQLKSAVKLREQRELSDLESQGLIQRFEFTHELAWKTLKNFLESKGLMNLYGSRDTTRARDDFRNGSDIDLTLYGGDELTHTVVSQISIDLDDQLLPYTIDLSIFKNLRNPEMIKEIERIGKIFYRR